MMDRDIDIVVIGGGAAGLAAAIKAKEVGVKDVVILDRDEKLGGILPQCIHTGFGLHYFKENLTGPEYISRFIEKAGGMCIECKLGTMVLKITRSKKVLAVNKVDGLLTMQAKAIILAMGCREKARGALYIPGTRPAGIYTAGTVQRLMDVEGYMPGKEVVILGSGDVGLIMARRFAMEGANVKAVVEMMPYPGGLNRNVVQCLEDFNIPLLLEHTITFIHGYERLEAVTVSKVDVDGNPIPRTERKIKCDTLILSVGLIPENELSDEVGIALDPATGGPIVNEYMETSIPGIFACGNVVAVYDLVDHVSYVGEVAGESAAKHIRNELPPLKSGIVLKPRNNVKYVVPQIISGERPVTIYMRPEKPMRNVKVNIGNLTFNKHVARPSEMVVIRLSKEELRRLKKGPELQVDIRGAEAMRKVKKDEREITCVLCPIGCEARVTVKDREIIEIKNLECPRGEEYVRREVEEPIRDFFTTVKVKGAETPVLPIRATKPIPKRKMPSLALELAKIIVDAPIKAGDIIAKNPLGLEVDIVATGSLARVTMLAK